MRLGESVAGPARFVENSSGVGVLLLTALNTRRGVGVFFRYRVGVHQVRLLEEEGDARNVDEANENALSPT
jgi:hypothetical protein